jgi:hypothetical protein
MRCFINGFAKVTNDFIVQSAGPDVERRKSKIAPIAALTARPRRRLKRGRNHSPIFGPKMPTHPSATRLAVAIRHQITGKAAS